MTLLSCIGNLSGATKMRSRISFMSVELWKVDFDGATVVFIACTVFTGAGALITGDISH